MAYNIVKSFNWSSSSPLPIPLLIPTFGDRPWHSGVLKLDDVTLPRPRVTVVFGCYS